LQVPIAIAGSKLCTEAVLSDLRIPEPDTYVIEQPTPHSSLDTQHRRNPLYVLEDVFTVILPYLVGIFLMAAIGLGALWYTGCFETRSLSLPPPPPPTFFEQHQAETVPAIDLGLRAPVILGGSLAIFVLSLLYIRLP